MTESGIVKVEPEATDKDSLTVQKEEKTELEKLKEDLEGTKQARGRWEEVLKKYPNGFEARQAIKHLDEGIKDWETEIKEKEGLFVFACVVLVWIGIEISGVL